MKLFTLLAVLLTAALTHAAQPSNDFLIQLVPESAKSHILLGKLKAQGAKVESLGINNWYRVVSLKKAAALSLQSLSTHPAVKHAQPNYRITLNGTWKIHDPKLKSKIMNAVRAANDDNPFPFPLPGDDENGGGGDGGFPFPMPGNGGAQVTDNPAIPGPVSDRTGTDPLFDHQWGMKDIGVRNAWNGGRGSDKMVVAVIDTGVDYTHEDLVANLWRNQGESGRDAQGRDKSSNGVDDDHNGYVDDVIGWDFSQNDNKPFDMPASLMDMLMKGGNPGHGTHCAGNVAARSDNSLGVVGVAPNVKVMPLRFISTEGQGTSGDAVKAIKYAVDNGAKVLSNSWGSEGEDANDPDNGALKDAIVYAQSKGVLFIAAAGNGHQGVGYDNDSDARPGYPASYSYDNIVSVAAIDSTDALGAFSNWGAKTVHIAAPGVKVFSTTVGSQYADTVIDLGEMLHATWDGTSMACPHVAGAAALYWSNHPEKTYKEVKEALIRSAKPITNLKTKIFSGGKLDVDSLMKQ